MERAEGAFVGWLAEHEGTFSTLHGRHPIHRTRFTGKVKIGKSAVTHFKVVKRFETASLVEIGLETGRTHQIRMHFAEAGFPLISDSLYGGKKAQRPDLIVRQALHSWKLAFARVAPERSALRRSALAKFEQVKSQPRRSIPWSVAPRKMHDRSERPRAAGA